MGRRAEPCAGSGQYYEAPPLKSRLASWLTEEWSVEIKPCNTERKGTQKRKKKIDGKYHKSLASQGIYLVVKESPGAA